MTSSRTRAGIPPELPTAVIDTEGAENLGIVEALEAQAGLVAMCQHDAVLKKHLPTMRVSATQKREDGHVVITLVVPTALEQKHPDFGKRIMDAVLKYTDQPEPDLMSTDPKLIDYAYSGIDVKKGKDDMPDTALTIQISLSPWLVEQGKQAFRQLQVQHGR